MPVTPPAVYSSSCETHCIMCSCFGFLCVAPHPTQEASIVTSFIDNIVPMAMSAFTKTMSLQGYRVRTHPMVVVVVHQIQFQQCNPLQKWSLVQATEWENNHMQKGARQGLMGFHHFHWQACFKFLERPMMVWVGTKTIFEFTVKPTDLCILPSAKKKCQTLASDIHMSCSRSQIWDIFYKGDK